MTVAAPRSRTRCVIVFARAPLVEARAKGMPAAERLFACARHRVLAAAAASGGDVILAAPGPAGPSPTGVRHLPQRGRSFAERLESAFADARALGYRDIVMVPADVPRLEARHLRTAFRRLGDRPTVLGPSPDGGVYLLGVRGDFAPVLAGIPWCTRLVCARLLAKPGGAALLPPLADVDSHRHLRALRDDPGLDAELSFLARALLVRAAFPRPGAGVSRVAAPCRSALASRPPPSAAA